MEGRGDTDRIQMESVLKLYRRVSSTECTYRPRRGELATIRRIPCTGSRYCFPVNVGCTDRGTVYQHGGRTNEHVDSSLIG